MSSTSAGLPPPNWPLVNVPKEKEKENFLGIGYRGERETPGQITKPWYSYFKAADETWRPKVVRLTSLSTVSDPTADLISNTGITLMESVPATTRTLANPVPGCRKTLCVTSTSSAGKVTLQSTAMVFRSQSTVAGTTGWKLVFSSTAPYKAVELVGISTFEYLIVSNIGSVVVATT